jgi:membrane-bound inhibitor of C-type lysozyme
MGNSLRTGAIFASLVSLALVGCNTPAENPGDDTAAESDMPETTAVVFECPDGETIEASFDTPEEAVVTLPGQEAQTLPITEAASGARYSDGKTTFWNKGNEAMVEVDGEVVLAGCMAQE